MGWGNPQPLAELKRAAAERARLPTLTIDVAGEPVPQGSKTPRLIWVGGKPKATLYEANPALLGKKGWRAKIITATKARMALDGWATLDGEIRLRVDFWMTRPATVKRARPTVPPDGDKLLRAVADALKIAGAIVDDSRIVSWRADEWYAQTTPGARIVVSAL